MAAWTTARKCCSVSNGGVTVVGSQRCIEDGREPSEGLRVSMCNTLSLQTLKEREPEGTTKEIKVESSTDTQTLTHKRTRQVLTCALMPHRERDRETFRQTDVGTDVETDRDMELDRGIDRWIDTRTDIPTDTQQ